jgi:WS/DGAT/MGAT family acyltransferase
MRQLSTADAAFVYMERPRTPSHVLPVFVYDPSTAPGGRVTFDDVLAHLSHRVHEARTLREKLVPVPLDLDRPYWVEDDSFDLEFHVRQAALPAPGRWADLMTLAARLHARPLDLTRPPWELYMVEGVSTSGRTGRRGFAIVMKVHHAAIDGVAGVELINVLHTATPEVEPLGPAAPVAGEPVPSNWDLLARSALNSMASPSRVARALRRSPPVRELRHLLDDARKRGVRPLDVAPRTRFSGTVSAHRVMDCVDVRLDDVKASRRAVSGATVNDVALTIVAGAMREYLEDKHELPPKPLTAMVPISVRVGDAGAGGNQISSMVVPIATHVADPIERLFMITQTTKDEKARREGVDVHSQMQLAEAMPGALLGVATRASTRLAARVPVANTLITNVPGSPSPLYLRGAKAVRQAGGGPLVDGMGLINLVGSYCDSFTLGFNACRDMMPDHDFYTECLRESAAVLLSAAS